jgi:hypothetical protein
MDIPVEEATNPPVGIRPTGPHPKNRLAFFDTVGRKAG